MTVRSWISTLALVAGCSEVVAVRGREDPDLARVDPWHPSVWSVQGGQREASAGTSLSSAGDVDGDGFDDFLVGSQSYHHGEDFEGRALLYRGSAFGLETRPAWSAEGDQDSWWFGSVSSAGDVNGDSYDDVIVGASGYSNGRSGEGAAFLYLGSAAGLATVASWTAESDQSSAHFGARVASAGDVNGDGYDDVLIGATAWDGGEIDEGRASVYHGSATGLEATAAWTAESDRTAANFGHALSAGDVNGDGYDDVVVAAPGDPSGGRVHVYLGGAAGLDPTPDTVLVASELGSRFGTSAAAVGDLNGDGYDDVAVGAPFIFGEVYVYFGSASGLEEAPGWSRSSDDVNSLAGMSVAGAGDTNGDGWADLLIGAPGTSHGQHEEGRIELYLGSPNGLAAAPSWRTEADRTQSSLGWSVASAGDVDGNGLDDLAAGAPSLDRHQHDEGAVFVFAGSPPGLAVLEGSCDGPVEVAMSGFTPGHAVTLIFGRAVGADPLLGGPCAGTITGLSAPARGGIRTLVNGAGRVRVPSVACGAVVQAVDLDTCAVTDLLSIVQ